MALNGSGTFARLYDWTDDRDAGVKIRADRMDAEFDGMATALSTALYKDGQQTPTANLPMGGFKHTGVADASAANQYATLGQLQNNVAQWADAGGTADAITATYTPTVTALTNGMILGVRAASANATTTPTFAPDGQTAHTIVKHNGQALVAGDIAGDGHELQLRYDSANTVWTLLNPKVPELATTAQTETGTDATRAVTPDGLHDMTTLAGAAWFLDEDDMASNDATKTASQQSIKAYVDSRVTGGGTINVSNNGTDATNDIDFSAGSVRDFTDTVTMTLASTLVKRLDAAWAVGTNQGGLDTGSMTAGVNYGLWIIYRSDTGVTDALFSTDMNALALPANIPANYDYARLVGMIHVAAGPAIIAFTQVGDYFRYMGDIIVDVNDNTITANTFESAAISAPPKSLAHIYASTSNGTAQVSIRAHVRTTGAADGAETTEALIVVSNTSGVVPEATASGMVLTNSSRQIDYASPEASGTATVTIKTIGFLMLTRSNPT